MPLNLHHLRVFAVVARLGGIGVAARALGVTQPAISRSIRELEAQVGVRLLERGAEGVVPTAAGRELYEHAQAVVAAERAADSAMAALRGLERGTLHVGASTTIATYVLPPLIGAFARAHPGIELRLSAVHTRMLVPLVRNHEVDVALAEAPVTHPRVVVTRWVRDEMVVIAAPSHHLVERARQGEVLLPGVLDEELLILREPESGTRDLVMRGLSAAGVAPARTMSVDGTEVIKQLVAEGVGVAVVSRDAVSDQVALGRLAVLPIHGVAIVRPFNRLALARHRPNAAARAFLRLLAAEAERREPGARRATRTHRTARPRGAGA
ncbi:MAG TPA: LysR substrate-binding domain-containing protein [Gemmatimonadaceae bacterium]|jgi:DNA-binding transcriptional LysR family regulator